MAYFQRERTEALAVFALGFLLLFFKHAVAADEVPDRPFEFESYSEKMDKNRCLLNSYRGETCALLMTSLCKRIKYENAACRTYLANRCHEQNPVDPEEAKCEKSPMFQYCYGNHAKCGEYEAKNCKASSYNERYCGHYQWLDCKKDDFKSLDCRKFANKLLIEYREDKLTSKLFWEAKGQNSSKRKLAQLEELKKRGGGSKDQMRELERKIQEYSFTSGMCQRYGPYQLREE